MRIVIMGPPGVGKGTEAATLTKTFNIPHISTGDIFRELYKDRTHVGKIAKEYISRGELVPDDITNEIVRHRLSHPDVKKGFLFDGYPRNIEQAKALDEFLEKKGCKLDAVINMTAPEKQIIERISGRRVCEKCGAVYHVISKKPKIDGICDLDGGKLIQRNDDLPKTVHRRLKIYNNQTAPVIGYYEEKGAIIYIDGTKPIADVQAQVMKALGELK
ncbi:MAG: adenylate kinase [Acholeplasmataceae bacterium]|nr:adenylate kinase [Acholeplasmataceae bacterium]